VIVDLVLQAREALRICARLALQNEGLGPGRS
jgi:hypothetical protein